MKKNTRKSTALISLVLVPLGLAGLGFTPGCDDRKSAGQAPAADDTAGAEQALDYGSDADAFTLDPVPPTGTGPTTLPATSALAQSSFAGQQPHPTAHYSHGGFMFLPIPYRAGYRPAPAAGFRPSPGFGRSSPGAGVSRSSPSSNTPRSGTVSRGGFGSSAGAHSSGSSGS